MRNILEINNAMVYRFYFRKSGHKLVRKEAGSSWTVKTPSTIDFVAVVGEESKVQIILTYFLGFGFSWAEFQYILLQWIQVGT